MMQISFFTITLIMCVWNTAVVIILQRDTGLFIFFTLAFLLQVAMFIVEPTKSYFVIFAAIPFIISAYKQIK